MNRLALSALAGVLGVGMLVASPDTAAAQQKAEPASAYRIHSDTTAAQQKAPPGGAYKKVSSLVPLPDFVPGLGTLYVDPATLPAGPFLAYDHQGNLVSSINMIPLKDMNARSEEHTSELQSPCNLVCRLLLEKKKKRLHDRIRKTRYMHKMRCLLITSRSLLLALRLLWNAPIFPSNSRFPILCAKCILKLDVL